MLMNDKVMFDRYYCIHSTKTQEKCENVRALYSLASSLTCTVSLLARVFHKYARFGLWSGSHD